MLTERRVLILGASGLLGGNLLQLLPETWMITAITNRTYLATASRRKNIAWQRLNLLHANERSQLARLVTTFKPQAVINAVAVTNVDRCEKEDRDAARILHQDLSADVAAVCRDHNIQLVHVSTDQIFDGRKNGPYTEEDIPNPINYYGESKFLAEAAVRRITAQHTIIRTNFFGFNLQDKNDLAGWVLAKLRNTEPFDLFDDVFFSPLLVNFLVGYVQQSIEKSLVGTYNIAARDVCTKYDFAVKLANIFDFDYSHARRISAEAVLVVPRPKNMALAVKKVESVFGPLPTVDDSIRAYKSLFDTQYQAKLRKEFIPV